MYIHNPSTLTASDPPLVPPGTPPRRSSPYEDEPGFYQDGNVWLYGNSRLLMADLAAIDQCFLNPYTTPREVLRDIERDAERLVLAGKTLVCGIHNDLHRQAAIVPLRWGAPRIVVLPGGFFHHLGKNLKEEPFRAARLWRYQWDAKTDLALSRRAPDKLPTFALVNHSVDRIIRAIAERSLKGVRRGDSFGPF